MLPKPLCCAIMVMTLPPPPPVMVLLRLLRSAVEMMPVTLELREPPLLAARYAGCGPYEWWLCGSGGFRPPPTHGTSLASAEEERLVGSPPPPQMVHERCGPCPTCSPPSRVRHASDGDALSAGRISGLEDDAPPIPPDACSALVYAAAVGRSMDAVRCAQSLLEESSMTAESAFPPPEPPPLPCPRSKTLPWLLLDREPLLPVSLSVVAAIREDSRRLSESAGLSTVVEEPSTLPLAAQQAMPYSSPPKTERCVRGLCEGKMRVYDSESGRPRAPPLMVAASIRSATGLRLRLSHRILHG